MARSSEYPKGADLITTYAEFNRKITAFADGHYDLLLIVGHPGSGKSKTLREAMAGKGLLINGRNTPIKIYIQLFVHRDQPVIIDDSECVLEQKTGKELLRSLTETDEVKHLSWSTTTIEKYDVPEKFVTRSKVCIICNRWVQTDSLSAAIADRAHIYAFKPTARELHRYVSDWFTDQEILEWFSSRLDYIDTPSARNYVKAAQVKAAGDDWRAYAERHFMIDAITAEVMEAHKNEALSAKEKLALVVPQKCSRATYYRVLADLRERGSVV